MKVLITGCMGGINLNDAIIMKIKCREILQQHYVQNILKKDNSFRGGSRGKGGKIKYERR